MFSRKGLLGLAKARIQLQPICLCLKAGSNVPKWQLSLELSGWREGDMISEESDGEILVVVVLDRQSDSSLNW